MPSKRVDVDLDQLENEMRSLIELAISGELFKIHPFNEVKQEQRRFNDLAFSGDGEPTLSKAFPESVAKIAKLKDSYNLSDVKLVLITNATRLQNIDVIIGIDTLMANNGQIWAKLDAGTAELYRTINRTGISLDTIISNLEFAGRRWPITIQTLFLAWKGTGPSEQELQSYLSKIKYLLNIGIKLQGLQLYTVARPTPEAKARPLSSTSLNNLASYITNELPGIPIDVYHGSAPAPEIAPEDV
jgi:wyosine [tRNA(Phe)-imidazoG37] synthetase (radical SAM superfamily)